VVHDGVHRGGEAQFPAGYHRLGDAQLGGNAVGVAGVDVAFSGRRPPSMHTTRAQPHRVEHRSADVR
jgi:hypothetical protein